MRGKSNNSASGSWGNAELGHRSGFINVPEEHQWVCRSLATTEENLMIIGGVSQKHDSNFVTKRLIKWSKLTNWTLTGQFSEKPFHIRYLKRSFAQDPSNFSYKNKELYAL